MAAPLCSIAATDLPPTPPFGIVERHRSALGICFFIATLSISRGLDSYVTLVSLRSELVILRPFFQESAAVLVCRNQLIRPAKPLARSELVATSLDQRRMNLPCLLQLWSRMLVQHALLQAIYFQDVHESLWHNMQQNLQDRLWRTFGISTIKPYSIPIHIST